MFPYEVTEMLRNALLANQRPPDGKLHASSHLTGSLRHVQLDAAGAPKIESDLVATVNLAVGTAVHSLFEGMFRGKPIMLEVKLDEWMPPGWSGTADWVAWDPEIRAFVLGDLKTTKPGGIHYIHKGGAKESHIWQVSAYWHALVRMGLPLLDRAGVYYLPKNQLLAREGEPVSPTMQEITPLPLDVVEGRMAELSEAVNAYRDSLPKYGAASLSDYLTDKLAPVQPREIKLSINKVNKRPVIDVKLAPSWSVEFCEFPDELCNCRRQTTNKIGSWDRDDSGMLVYSGSDKHPQLTPDLVRKHHRPDPALVAALVRVQREKENA